MSVIHGLFSKWPENTGFHTYYNRAKGAMIDGFIDFSYMGVGSCILGYADPDVNKTVKMIIDRGSMSTLNCFEENILFEMFQSFNPWMKSVRFAKCGGDAVHIAYKVASYFRGTKKYVSNGYCGWQLSHFDRSVEMENCHRIGFDSVEELKAVPDDIDIYIIELARSELVSKEYAEVLKEKTKNKILIIDEITSGFRWMTGGIHGLYGIKPNFAVYGKAIANGYPLAVVCGDDMMNMVKNDVFISSTQYTERIGMSACIATLLKILRRDVVKYIHQIGKEYKDIFKFMQPKPGNGIVQIDGIDKKSTNYFYSKNILIKDRFYPSFAHNEKHLKKLRKELNKILEK